MNPDEILIREIRDVLEKDLNKLYEILRKGNLDKKGLDEAFFLTQEIQMYLYKLFSFTT